MVAFSAGELLTAAKLNAFVDPDAWTVFTPTWTNVTVGNGTSDCSYMRAGNLIIARYKLTFGSTTAITGVPQPGLPVTAVAGAALASGAITVYRDVSAASNYLGIVHVASTTVVQFSLLGRANATDAFAGVSATLPFTWAVSDTLGGTVVYEAA